MSLIFFLLLTLLTPLNRAAGDRKRDLLNPMRWSNRLHALRYAKYSIEHFPTCTHSIDNLRSKANEDRYISQKMGLSDGRYEAYLHGVFDGHGGAEVSDYLQQNLPKELYKFFRRHRGLHEQDVVQLLMAVVYNMDRKLCTNWDSEIYESAGSTGAFVLRIRDVAYVVNVGDSRTLVLEDGKLIFNTTDHKPSDAVELDHVNRAGGIVTYFGTARVNMVLAMSRAFGDCYLKRKGGDSRYEEFHPEKYSGSGGMVRVTPDITTIRLASTKKYTFLSATDGLFDVISNKHIEQFLRKNGTHEDTCKFMATRARQIFSNDDITAVIVNY